MCKVQQNSGSGIFGTDIINDKVYASARKVDDAFKTIKNLKEGASQEEILQAQTALQEAKIQFDLLQEMKKMINEIYQTIIRNINIR